MLEKLYGSEQIKKFGGVEFTALPMSAYSLTPLIGRHAGGDGSIDMLAIGEEMARCCIVDTDAKDAQFTTVRVGGKRRRVVVLESIELDSEHIVQLYYWLWEINNLTEGDKKN